MDGGGLNGGSCPDWMRCRVAGRRRGGFWLPAVLWVVSSALMTTLLALAVNAASETTAWPGLLSLLQRHPFRWAAGLTVVVALTGLLWVWWQQRLELADDQSEPSPRGPVVRGEVVKLPPRNLDFTGRSDLFAKVTSELANGPVAVVTVHGMGGIGKSQLALEFAHRGVAAGRYAVAWWVRAETPLTSVVHEF
jgi:hypothetical protein